MAWQLSEQLKERIVPCTERERVRRDAKYCDDIRRSCRSAPANIAEGFGYYGPRQNARYVTIARGSLTETINHLLDGYKRGHLSAEEKDDLLRLARRALGATSRYLRYLQSCKEPPPGKPYKPNQNAEPEP